MAFSMNVVVKFLIDELFHKVVEISIYVLVMSYLEW